MTEQHSPTNASGLNASLADAAPVRSPRTGRTSLMNTKTGEQFYSYCSAHWSWDPDCSDCQKGAWAWPVAT